MVRIIAVACCLVLLGAPARPSAQTPVSTLTLDEAMSLAGAANPTVRAKEFEVQAVGANEITASLRPNPATFFLAEQFGSGSAHQTQYTLNVGQTIELGGKRQRRVDSAKAATKVTGFELVDLKRQVVFQVKKSFTDILVAREALALAEQNLVTLDNLEKLQRIRAEKGDLSGLELLRIQVQRFAFERDAADALQALKTGKIALRALLGVDKVNEQYDVTGSSTSRRRPTPSRSCTGWLSTLDRMSGRPRRPATRSRPTSISPRPMRGLTSRRNSSTSASVRTTRSALAPPCPSSSSTETRARSPAPGPTPSEWTPSGMP